ncbi:hypothetical protein RclHR1_01420008 [Rhizophagus clarus]|uniref:Uncharacterized protein n=1 Tax=Rhizophagus clarus TaxID=94130 RepID=A0A2Z6QDQ9_9GLOM|nr:hypothetical protein RclHR1_01420008 [Rhizophagus clarus]GES95061.1 hypothetical protein GLOIN_2v1660456 [Rhizophagus clarus]
MKQDDDVDKEIILYHLKNIDIYDEATIYVVRCFLEIAWISCFSGKCQSERTVDIFIVGPNAKTPCTIFFYVKIDQMLIAKTKQNDLELTASNSSCIGSHLGNQILEKTGGPLHKDNHDHHKSITNFIE